jgi:hypothetical protein
MARMHETHERDRSGVKVHRVDRVFVNKSSYFDCKC